MTLEEFAELVLTMRLAQNDPKAPLFGVEWDVDNALLTILPDVVIRSSTTGKIKRRTPRPDPPPTSTAFDGGPHGWW